MRVLGPAPAANAPAPAPAPTAAKPKGLDLTDVATKLADVLGLHGAVDTISSNLATLLHPVLASKGYIDQPTLKQDVGAGLSLGSTLASVAAPTPATVGKTAAQFGTLAAAQTGGADLAEKKDLPTAAEDAAKAGAIGAAAGGTFKLLGRALSKGGPAALSFTSGVPSDAIEQAAKNPAAAKAGLDTNVEAIRNKAVGSLQSLYTDLGSEFDSGLKHISANVKTAPEAGKIPVQLLSDAKRIASEFKVGATASKEGLVADFSKSAIVKGGETTNVQHALDTLSSWTDFSPQGMQDLEARIGALRNFDSGGQTRSSAVIGKIYNSVNDAIKQHYPQLAQLRSDYATNRKALDEISNALSATKNTPVSIQSSITRLSNIFKTDREQYVSIVKNLADRSGVDYLSLLAGTEFQKVLPGFIRGVGGGSAVSVGASVLNPFLLLLAPLFSPRVAGVIARNAPAVAKTAAPVVRAATTQAIQRLSKSPASQ